MIDEDVLRMAGQILEHMSTPRNALGIWVAATGIVAGAYLLEPLFFN